MLAISSFPRSGSPLSAAKAAVLCAIATQVGLILVCNDAIRWGFDVDLPELRRRLTGFAPVAFLAGFGRFSGSLLRVDGFSAPGIRSAVER
jgi:hypothetical protein